MQSEKALARHGFSVGSELFANTAGQCIVLPFKRSAIAILVLMVIAVVMTVPAVSAGAAAARELGSLDTLFDLVSALFMLGWLLGWSVGLFVIYALFAVFLAGRETLVLHSDRIEVRMGLPFLFVRTELDPALITGLQHWIPKPKSSRAWRGPHLVFDYDGNRREIGSDLSPDYARELAGKIRSVRGSGPRRAASRAIVHKPVREARRQDGMSRVPVKDATKSPAGLWTPATLALLAANVVPLIGVLFWQWDLGMLMALFWAESGIIGFYNLLKITVVQRWFALLLVPFFVGHFGAFMAVHFLFVYELFVARETGAGSSLPEVGQFFYLLWPALLALLLSHGMSFVYNFLGRREYHNKTVREQMSEPYRRVVIMHVTLIFGGGLTLLLGSPLAALLLLVMLKIAADIHAHRQQYRQ